MLQDAVASLICEGTTERFPGLKFALVENGAGWVPGMLGWLVVAAVALWGCGPGVDLATKVLLSSVPAQIVAANWDSLVFDVGESSLQRVPMLEPTRGTAATVGPLIDAASSAADLLARLRRTQLRMIMPYVV